MRAPLDQATAQPPATLGEGCLSRYDLARLDPGAGTDFPGAAELWQALHAPEPDLQASGVGSPGGHDEQSVGQGFHVAARSAAGRSGDGADQ